MTPPASPAPAATPAAPGRGDGVLEDPAPPGSVQLFGPHEVGWGIQLPVQAQSTLFVEDWERGAGPADMAAVARQADDSGATYVGVCDHTAVPERLVGSMGATWYDTVATLGWLAGVTTGVRLLSNIYVAALRHPLRSAKEFATLDVLSGGRVIVGLGAGHVVEEFEAMERDFAGRGALLDEAADGIAAALVAEVPQLRGPRWPSSTLAVAPRPVQQPRPPIWIGGSTRPALRRAARRGDGWIPQTARRDELAAQIDELRRWRDDLRPGAPIEIGALVPLVRVGDTGGLDLPRWAVTGSPGRVAEALGAYTVLGVAHLQVHFVSRSPGDLCDQIGRFGAEVAPALAR